MSSRLDLHEELCDLLGNRNVYFQPPETIKMRYPCIRYSKIEPSSKRADDRLYGSIPGYEGVAITTDPDSDIPDKLLNHFSMCRLGKGYISDNLYHTPFTIYN